MSDHAANLTVLLGLTLTLSNVKPETLYPMHNLGYKIRQGEYKYSLKLITAITPTR